MSTNLGGVQNIVICLKMKYKKNNWHKAFVGSQKGNDVGRSCGCQGCAFGSCFSLSLLALASWAVQGHGASPSLAVLPVSSVLDQCDQRAGLGAGAGWSSQPSGTEQGSLMLCR